MFELLTDTRPIEVIDDDVVPDVVGTLRRRLAEALY